MRAFFALAPFFPVTKLNRTYSLVDDLAESLRVASPVQTEARSYAQVLRFLDSM